MVYLHLQTLKDKNSIDEKKFRGASCFRVRFEPDH